MLKKLAIAYFNFFSNKNIKKVEGALSENVTLNDWNVSCSGKYEVMSATKSIFDSIDTIDVKPKNIFCDKNVVIAELEIVINNAVTECVVDVISFDENNLITSIEAYKK